MGEKQDAISGQYPIGHAQSELQLGSLYAAYAAHVRRSLAEFGVTGADIDDLCHEVFLIVGDKRETLGHVEHMGRWLREISRKVAAGNRRRDVRQRQIPIGTSLSAPDENAPPYSAVLESREDEARLYQAVDALDAEAKDLIALHELGGLPLVEIATLVARDRKTVRKRLQEANRRLSWLFRERPAVPVFGRAARAPHSPPLAALDERVGPHVLQVLGQTPDIAVGRIGAVLIAIWPGPPTLDALSLLDSELSRAAQTHGHGLVYLAIVESSTSTPSLEARQRISSMLKRYSTSYGVFPHVLLGGFSWIARPIMAGLAFLSGVELPMPFFGSIEQAAAWLTAGYLSDSSIEDGDIIAAIQSLRAVAAANTGAAASRSG